MATEPKTKPVAMPEQQMPMFPNSPELIPRPAPARPAPRSRPALTSTSALSVAIGAWKEALAEEGRAENTIKSFAADIKLLGKYLGIGQPVGDIGTRDLNTFLRWLQKDRGIPCSPKSYARRVTSLKSFFKWLVEIGVLTVDPAAPVIQQSVISPLPEILTDEEIDRLLVTTKAMRQGEKPDARPYLLVSLLVKTGIKKSECVAIHPNHIDTSELERPTLYIRYNKPTLRYKERRLPLDSEWPQVLAEYRQQYPVVDRIFDCTPRNLEYVLEDAAEQAGVGKHVSFEMLRWTCGVRDFRAGTDAEQIRLKLGLSKISWRETQDKINQLSARLDEGQRS